MMFNVLSSDWYTNESQLKTPIKENRVTTKEKLTAVVRIIETRLESNEKETRDLESQMIEEIEKVDQKIDQINSSLDDIENKNTKMDQRFRPVYILELSGLSSYDGTTLVTFA